MCFSRPIPLLTHTHTVKHITSRGKNETTLIFIFDEETENNSQFNDS